ncbi:MAG: hydroxymethylpyrimidine/phosphomethylpyrimidine kinase [Spongiibacteraceae bacterium]|nr:hydroxymethylpyrimidine/phosphomethylpyrimidine kinase [Spongiibacteraceae bacterium]
MNNNRQQKKPIVWTIGGSDSSGNAGIQADLLTFQDLGVHGCSVITALNAQNSFALGYTVATERKNVVAQINALDSDLPAAAIKVGMLANREIVETVIKYFDDYRGFVVYEPVLDNCQGGSLLDDTADLINSLLLPRIDCLTPNMTTAGQLSGVNIDSPQSLIEASEKLLAMGTRSVLITGARFDSANGKRLDFWSNGNDCLWLSGDDIQTVNDRAGGCMLSAAITAGVGHEFDWEKTLTLAKSYVTQGIRGAVQIGSGPGAAAHLGWPEDSPDVPIVSEQYPGTP